MKTIEDILTTFTDTELAYLNKYQLDTYLTGTQDKISDYIFNKRRLSQAMLDKLISDNTSLRFSDDRPRCPRCKTDKLRTDSVDWAIPLFRAGAEDEYAMLSEIQTGQTYRKDKITCNVCGYVLYDPDNEKRPFYKKIADFVFDNPVWTLFGKK